MNEAAACVGQEDVAESVCRNAGGLVEVARFAALHSPSGDILNRGWRLFSSLSASFALREEGQE